VESEFGDGRAPSLCRPSVDGETMTDVCRDFGVSRKDRLQDSGLIVDQSAHSSVAYATAALLIHGPCHRMTLALRNPLIVSAKATFGTSTVVLRYDHFKL